MCTAVTYQTNDFYFGRNLDLYYRYRESVTITPRKCPFIFRNGKRLDEHYAMIGMATVEQGHPLYYEATNEKGLSMAGLNFPGNAVYWPFRVGRVNIASFELIPWILAQCATARQALDLLQNVQIWDQAFSDAFPPTPLHWMLADRQHCYVLEPTNNGLEIHENPYGVLTNNPPFEFHRYNVAQYLNLTANPPVNRFSRHLELKPFSLGMGSIGLPGDPSSPSRFVKAAFTRANSYSGTDEMESVSQFFHILSNVAQLRGVTGVGDGKYEYTLYSCCCNADRGIYYYTTYDNSRISAVNMYSENLDTKTLIFFPLRNNQDILMLNDKV